MPEPADPPISSAAIPYPTPIAPLRSAEDRWFDYLYHPYSHDTLWRWARAMRFFRFVKAVGGHAGGEDEIRLALRFQDQSDLLGLLEQLHLPIRRYPPGTPQPEPGKRYTAPEYRNFPDLIRAHPTLGQPGRAQIAGHRIYASVAPGRLDLNILEGGENWLLTDRSVHAAQELEPHIVPFASRLLDPPVDRRHCICPKYYPLFWSMKPPAIGTG